MAGLKGLVVSPTGKEHAVDSLEEAVRFIVILSDELTKNDYTNILKTLTINTTKSYTWNGWVITVDKKARRKGVGVVVKCNSTGIEKEFGSIKECALEMGLKEQKVRSLINAYVSTHDNKTYRKAETAGW